MLKLTVLRRYSEEGRRVCKIIGEMIFEYSEGRLTGNKNVNSILSGIFNLKYAEEKKLIYEQFTSNNSLEQVFKEIRKKGLKIEEVKFDKDDTENVQVVILIEE